MTGFLSRDWQPPSCCPLKVVVVVGEEGSQKKKKESNIKSPIILFSRTRNVKQTHDSLVSHWVTCPAPLHDYLALATELPQRTPPPTPPSNLLCYLLFFFLQRTRRKE